MRFSYKLRGKSYQLQYSNGSGESRIRDSKTVRLDDNIKGKKQIEEFLFKEMIIFKEEMNRKYHQDVADNMKLHEFVYSWRETYKNDFAPKTLARYDDLIKRIVDFLGDYRIKEIDVKNITSFYDSLRQVGANSSLHYIAKDEFVEYYKSLNINRTKFAANLGVNIKTITTILEKKPTNKAKHICICLKLNINNYFDKCEGKGLSNRTILHHHRLLNSIFEEALRLGYITKNPVRNAKKPKIEICDEKEFYNIDEVSEILKALEVEPIKYKAMITLAIYSGIRLGELCGLEWSDIDFAEGRIRIKQSAQYLAGKGVFVKNPKNRTSKRTITISAEAMSVMKCYKAWYDEQKSMLTDQWADNDFVFVQSNGDLIFPKTPADWFYKFVKRHGIRRVNFHGLRHTHSAILISTGTNIQTIATRLGHAKATTTLNCYSHYLKEPDEVAAQVFGSIFGKSMN